MWLWGCRPLLEEQVLCLPSLWQLCSQLRPPSGWSSLSIASRLGSQFACCPHQMSSVASVVPSGTEPGCGWYLCASIFSAVVGKKKTSPPSLSSALTVLVPGDELEAYRIVLYVQPLAAGSCTASLCTTWRMTFLHLPFILLPAGSLWWLLSRKRRFDRSLCTSLCYTRFCGPLIPLQHLSHRGPPTCLCASGYLPFSGGASITAALVWVVCKLALIRRNKPTNS